jgi:hypothetical protein
MRAIAMLRQNAHTTERYRTLQKDDLAILKRENNA